MYAEVVWLVLVFVCKWGPSELNSDQSSWGGHGEMNDMLLCGQNKNDPVYFLHESDSWLVVSIWVDHVSNGRHEVAHNKKHRDRVLILDVYDQLR